jgi:hypothetical protein
MIFKDRTIEDLVRSGLNETDAKYMGVVDFSATDTRELTRGAFNASAYQIPYRDRTGADTPFFRLRFHEAQTRSNAKGKTQRYWQPPRSTVQLYMPSRPGTNWDKLIANSKVPILATEGEKKAHAAQKHKLNTVSVPGVHSFGSKAREIELLPELTELAANGRDFRVVYDADTKVNPDVARAEREISWRAFQAGANVAVVQLPYPYSLDDYLKEFGPDALLKLPTRPFDVKAQISVIRELKLSERARRERIWTLMGADMNDRGTFHKVPSGAATDLYYFNRESAGLLSLNSASDRDTLSALSQRYSVNGSEAEWRWLHDEIANHATRCGQTTTVHSFATIREDKRAMYIYNGDGGVFKVTDGGWTREANGVDGVLFRNPSMAPVEVADSASPDAAKVITDTANFADGVHIKADQARLLFDLWTWLPFFPELNPTRPILLLNGEKGSTKTSTLRRLKQTLSGPQAQVMVLDPKRLDGLIAALSSETLVIIDNADGQMKELENLLATAATGGQFVLRELFTTNDRREVRLTAFVAATSRDPRPFRRDDVADRLLPLPVSRFTTFIEESRLDAQTTKNRPLWWRYALDTLPKILEALRTQRPRRTAYRLADFTHFAFAVGPVLGYQHDQIDAALEAIEKERNAFVAEGSRLPDALEVVCRTVGWIEVPPRQQEWVAADRLLALMKLHTLDCPFHNAATLARAVRDESAALRSRGFVIKTRKGHNHKLLYDIVLNQSAEKES